MQLARTKEARRRAAWTSLGSTAWLAFKDEARRVKGKGAQQAKRSQQKAHEAMSSSMGGGGGGGGKAIGDDGGIFVSPTLQAVKDAQAVLDKTQEDAKLVSPRLANAAISAAQAMLAAAQALVEAARQVEDAKQAITTTAKASEATMKRLAFLTHFHHNTRYRVPPVFAEDRDPEYLYGVVLLANRRLLKRCFQAIVRYLDTQSVMKLRMATKEINREGERAMYRLWRYLVAVNYSSPFITLPMRAVARAK